MDDFALIIPILGVVFGVAIGVAIIGVGIYMPDVSADKFSNCVLYKKILLGDNSELVGKIPVEMHYYNSTYICDGHFESRVEKSQ